LGIEWDYGVNEVRWSHFALLFVVCMLCHGELYRRRPVDTRRLTEFYLCMSVGGAFGGLFVTLVATQWFDDYHEWLMALLVGGLVGLPCVVSHSGFKASCLGGASVGVSRPWSWWLCWWSCKTRGLGARSTRRTAQRFYWTKTEIFTARFRCQGTPIYLGARAQREGVFQWQCDPWSAVFVGVKLRHVPTTYYARDSGIGETLLWAMSKSRISRLRSSVWVLAPWPILPGADAYDFYEINPAAVRFAQEWFDNLIPAKRVSKIFCWVMRGCAWSSCPKTSCMT
jgi:hypothetical protein